jgi:hypothetical protein
MSFRRAIRISLPLLAILAMGVAGASTVSAAGEKFHVSEVNVIPEPEAITPQEFEASIGTIKCKEIFMATGIFFAKTSTEIKTIPSYQECEAVIGGKLNKLHFVSNFCEYTWTSERTGEHAPMHIKCAQAFAEMEFKITIFGIEKECIKIPPQTPAGGGLSYTNKNRGSGSGDIVIKPTVSQIEYTVVGSCGNEVKKNGVYRGEFTLKVVDHEGNPKELWWE